MRKALHIILLVTFSLGAFAGLWVALLCSDHDSIVMPQALPCPEATTSMAASSQGAHNNPYCLKPMALDHVQAWRERWQTFLVPTAVLAGTLLLVALAFRLMLEFRSPTLRGNFWRLQTVATVSDHMKIFDPLQAALSRGIVQRGSLNQ